MNTRELKVEVAFDLTGRANAPFFTLDDSVKGRLDNTLYRLGGIILVDVTDRVRAVSIERGKDPLQFGYPAGECQVEFDNNDRAFDPLYEASPYFGNIVPRRELRISMNDIPMYRGWIEDWDLVYTRDNNARAIAKAFDALFLFNNQVVLPHTPTEQLTGERINAVLDRSEVDWPADLRDIDAGGVTVAANELTEANNLLTYLQSIAGSDPGDIFINNSGQLAFRDRTAAPTSASLVEFGTGGVPIDNLTVTYGSELLFNQVTITRQNGGTVTVTDNQSIDAYGVRSMDITDSQASTDAQVAEVALGLATLYSQPEYRFNSFEVYLHNGGVTQDELNAIIGLDLGSICKVTFTPSGIGDPIERYVEVINISHQIEVDSQTVGLGFKELKYAPLVLDDVVFGKLDVGTLSW